MEEKYGVRPQKLEKHGLKKANYELQVGIK